MTSQIVITYVLKTILISGIFLAYYWIALRDKKFHYYNRFYLLTASIMSLVIPLLKFDWFIVEKPVLYSSNEIVQFIIPVSNVNKSIQYDWLDYSLVISGIVAITLVYILLLNVIKIQLLKRKSDVTKMEGFDFINTNDDNAPFSFLNNLFWKQSISLQDEGGQQIFKHEITHIQQKHTWDRIYSQIVTSIFWMNPFNWIIQKELVTIHEFIADESAVGNSNVEAFAKMLLQTHYGNHFLIPTHQFFYSSIKRRLTMLTKSTNTKYSYLRRVMGLPILIATVCLVSIKVNATERIENKVNEIKNTIDLIVSDTTKPKKITPPKPPTPPNPSSAKFNYYINGEKIKIAEGAPLPTSLPKPSFYLNGVKVTEKEMYSISVNDIESVNVLNGEKAKKIYKEDGKNGVMIITTKSTKTNLQNTMDEVVVIGYSNSDTGVSAVFIAPKIQKNVDPYNDAIFSSAEKPAEFPGGKVGWSKYLMNNLDRNLPNRNSAVPGKYTVKLNFIVNKNGDVENVIAENNPGYGTAAEAIRVIEKGPKWIPAEQNGRKVNFLMKQVIVFYVTDK
ncbi:MAG: energy transducer TonB [Chitinophagaceae bacterium]|nr:energy transducer TonB [Chitinophagaceae bacterium]